MAGIGLFLRMLRPNVAYILLIFAALGMAQGGYVQHFAWQSLAVVIIIAAWYVNATTVNDLADYEIDRINLKGVAERPLANKRVSRGQILRLNVFSAILALAGGFLVDVRIGLLSVVCLLANYLYSTTPAKISHRGALAPLLLPAGYVAFPYLIGAWSLGESITHDGWLLLLALYVSFIGRIILKDFRDVKGDAAFGKRTFILRHGRKATCLASAFCLTAGSLILATIVPYRAEVLVPLLALLGCSLSGLRLLYAAHGRKREQIIIGSIVKAASGAVIIVLAVILMGNDHRSLLQQNIAAVVLGSLFAAMFLDTMTRLGTRQIS